MGGWASLCGQEERTLEAELLSLVASGRARCVALVLWKLMFFCRLIQEEQERVARRLAEQMRGALQVDSARLARDAARIEAEQERKRQEKEAKQKAALESIAEHRATVVRNLG